MTKLANHQPSLKNNLGRLSHLWECCGMPSPRWSSPAPTSRWSWGYFVPRSSCSRPWVQPVDVASPTCSRPTWSRCWSRRGHGAREASARRSRTSGAWRCHKRGEHQRRRDSIYREKRKKRKWGILWPETNSRSKMSEQNASKKYLILWKNNPVNSTFVDWVIQ